MKKILVFSLLTFLGLFLSGKDAARADERSAELLGRLREKVRGFTSYRLDFTAAVEGDGAAKGTLTVSGRRFVTKIRGQELYFDGTTLWNYIPQQEEVTIERLDPNDPSVLSNPSKLMNIDPQDYDHRSLPEVSTPKGKKLAVVELVPKVQTQDYTTIVLSIDPATALPERISIATPSAEKPIELTIERVQTGIPVSESTFRFDPKTHPGVETIDFR